MMAPRKRRRAAPKAEPPLVEEMRREPYIGKRLSVKQDHLGMFMVLLDDHWRVLTAPNRELASSLAQMLESAIRTGNVDLVSAALFIRGFLDALPRHEDVQPPHTPGSA